MTLAAYRPRRMVPLEPWAGAEQRLKPYTIALAEAADPSPEVVSAARDHALSVIPPAARAEGEGSGLGFVILHEGEAGTWLLMNWWAHGDICCGRLMRAEPGGAHFVPVDERPLVACVWELRVIDHEARAWVRTMMNGCPDPDAYLADYLPRGLH